MRTAEEIAVELFPIDPMNRTVGSDLRYRVCAALTAFRNEVIVEAATIGDENIQDEIEFSKGVRGQAIFQGQAAIDAVRDVVEKSALSKINNSVLEFIKGWYAACMVMIFIQIIGRKFNLPR